MSNILLISGHPNLQQSLANRTIIEHAYALLPELNVRRLDTLYPNFQIDVPAEQAALVAADVIVWQFPLHWYSFPALLKKWVDDTLVYGFAHGATGDKLHGKKLILSFTTGAPEAAYHYNQTMNYPIEDFLPAMRQTALLCGMDFQMPVFSQGMMYVPNVSPDSTRAEVVAKAQDHAERLVAQLKGL